MKKTTMMLFAFSLFGLLSTTLMAQNIQQQTPIKKCAFDEHESFLRANDPTKQTVEQFEAWIAPKIAQIQADRAAGKNIQVVYNIPVVIHIIHNGDALGTGENITDAQALSQINVLNQDFRRMVGTPGYNTDPNGADIEINFCIAQTDPSGVATTGIEHINYPPTNNAVANGPGGPDWEKYAEIDAMKAATGWDPNNYMNFWVVRLANAPSGMTGSDFAGGVYGFATFPGGAANVDGAICHFNGMGTAADNDGSFILGPQMGRTMTHEVGHWLSLYHTFGSGTPYSCTNSDFCNDTPFENGYQFGCPTKDTCPSDPGADPTKNYMDYSDDSCMNMFTNDQKARIVAVLSAGGNARRISVRNSIKCQTTTPIIKYVNPMGSINEDTNCNFTDVNFPIQIGKGPSVAATVTFDVTGSTAAAGVDYQIMTPSVNFAAGSTAVQNMTIRVFHDGLVEGNETINVALVLNANGGNAVLDTDPTKVVMAITIVDNDVAPAPVVNNTIFTEDFQDMSDWSQMDADGDGKAWLQFTTGTPGTAGKAAASVTDNTIYGGTGSLTPNNYLISSAISIPTGVDATILKYNIGTFLNGAETNYAEHYSVYFTPNISSQATIQAGTLLESATVPTAYNCATKTFDLTTLGLAGQTGYLVFRHHNTTGNGILLVDTVDITTTKTTNVQTTANTATAYNGSIPATGTAHAMDSATGNMILSVNDNDNFNYGCNTISVSRDQAMAGAPAVNYGTNTANNLKVMAKSFTVATVTSNPTGTSAITFYFTEAEIAAWETATGNLRANLQVLKQGSGYTPATIGSFGATNVTLTTTLTSGANGVYFFGKAPIPTVSYAATTGIADEDTDCSFTDYNYPILLNTAASADATVTFNVTPGTATQGVDYQIVNPTATFTAGTTTTQNLTVRVFNDGLVEGPENFNVTLTLNANGGDAVLDPAAQDMAITINDDDFTPTTEPVQDLENTATAYNVSVSSTGTVYATDDVSDNIMLSLTNNDAFDYGCTTVAVSRDQVMAGAAAVNFGTNTDVREQVLAKVFTVTTANSNPTGNVNYTFYFTEAEIAAWETATGSVRADLKVIKLGDTTYTPATLGAYGTEVTLTASFAAGAAGAYHFGIDLNPTISFDAAAGSANELTDCNFTDVTFPLSIEKAASANADVTFNVTGGTANAADYQIIPASVTFPAGTTAPQNMTVRVLHDGIVEGPETIGIALTLNANGGDAVLHATDIVMTITINDDDIAPAAATVQDTENTATAYQAAVSQTGTAYAVDNVSGNIMLSLTDNDNFDYGCTTVAVTRDAVTAGAPSVDFGTNTATNLQVMAKVFTVTPTNPNPTGSVTYTFYFTEAEIAAWEAATGESRNNLRVVKFGETTYSTAVLGTYGATDVTLTASFANGAGGAYHFGIDSNPTIGFDNPTGIAVENTNCNFTDVTFPISILTGASADADITFNVTGGTATQGVDYQIIPASVTFLAGTTTPQDMTVRVFHDGIVESNETINVSLVLNANGGDAILDAAAQDMTITINDDDVTPISTTPIQDVVNTATAYNALVSQSGIANATDNTSGNIMLSLTDNDGFDYGCTTVSVSRDATTAGAPAVDFGTNTATNLKVMAKVFTVTTVNPNPAGSVDYTFYFTEAEIAAWEAATGNLRTDLKVIKFGETTYTTATLGTFGATGVTLTASFAAGASGDYHFGATMNPAISFDNATGNIAENTNCSFTDMTFPISIDNAASANADISFMVTGGTAVAADYQIIPASVTFPAGTTTSQNLTVRVFHDGLVEGAETINIMMMLNANGGDATLNAAAQDMVITINDDDAAPTAGGTVTVFTEDWEALGAGWLVIDGDGDTKNWQTINGAEGLIGAITGVCAGSETDLTILGGPTAGTATPNNYIISPVITIPSGISSATLTYLIGYYTGGSGAGEHYEVYFTADPSTEASILAGTVVQADTITPASLTTEQRTNDLTALAGQTGYLVYRHIANLSGDGVIFLDTIDLVASTSGAMVQTAVNTATAYNASVTHTGTAYATDSVSGDIMLSLTDNDGADYGCTNVSVSRNAATAGAPAVDFGGNTATNLKVMAKVFSVTTANAPAGSVDYTFYFTEAEIASWEAATGNVRADLKVVKLGSTTYMPVTIGAFGASGVTLTASFSAGAAGDYHFGIDPVLATTTFELSNNISIYPNPTKDVLNISISSEFGLPTSYTIYNSLGQVIKNVNRVAQKDLTISTAAYSNGVYFIKIEKDGTSITKKFIKN